ncbi:MAG TPA: hypothetical protein VGJ74_23015 [Burkholderiales bacterium]
MLRKGRREAAFLFQPFVPIALDDKLARAGFQKIEGRYCNFIFHPLHELHAGAAMAINRRLTALGQPPLAGFLGSQYVVKAGKPL